MSRKDRLTTDRRILFFLTEFVWPSIAVPTCERRAEERDDDSDDGQV